MLEVVATLRNEVVGRWAVGGPRVGIGRTPDNAIQLNNMALSRHHAELTCAEGCWTLRDLGSRNGVFVNGKRRVQHGVNDGDVIVIGKFRLDVILKQAAPSARPGVDDLEGFVRQGKTLSLPYAVQALEPELELPVAHLRVRSGTRVGRISLQRDVVYVGSAAGCEVRIYGLRVPKRLAMIVRGRAGFTLLNLSPRERDVVCNGQPAGLRRRLEDGDRLELTTVNARFHDGPPPC
ncbi:MAG: FHA domain-containing protein [Planctomycetes bacterium]|nr:FHA domain-containing protein [Planctomycetota bacterium]